MKIFNADDTQIFHASYRIAVDNWVRADWIRQKIIVDQPVPNDADDVDQSQRHEELHV